MTDKNESTAPSANPSIRTLSRGLAALEAVADAEDGASVTEVAATVGVDKGTASRLLASLRQAGYLRQRQDRRLELGTKVGWLARRYGTRDDELVRAAQPHLRALRDATQETVHLAIVEGTEVVYLSQEEPDRSVRVHSAIGTRLPLYRTAMGRAVVAFLEGGARERALDAIRRDAAGRGEDPALTEFTAGVEAAEQQGWAAIDRNDEVTRLAAVVVSEEGEPVAAITLSGPNYRMQTHLESSSQLVIETASAISAALSEPGAAEVRH